MTNITFSVDENIHEKMRLHSEIKWTELLRNFIEEKLNELEQDNTFNINEIKEKIGKKYIKILSELDEKTEIKNYKKIQKMEEERLEQLLELEKEK